MAKGRKLTTSRSERLLGTYYDFVHTQMITHSSNDSLDHLGEEDIWSMVDDSPDRLHSLENYTENHVATRLGHGGDNPQIGNNRRRHNVGGLSVAFEDSAKGKTTSSSRIVHRESNGSGQSRNESGQVKRGGGLIMATSAPVNVPDWSKIYRVNSVESMHDSDEWAREEFESEMIPPHEYLARSRSKAATSVFEGVGRTLKGRDLSRVRDAVWSQTGFDG